jgi:hypothetical protein
VKGVWDLDQPMVQMGSLLQSSFGNWKLPYFVCLVE